MNPLNEKVAAYKLIARESLRMQLISPRLSKIDRLENDIASVNECINNANHSIKVEVYEISKLDQDHPNFEKTKGYKEEALKELDELVKHYGEHVVEIEKEIALQKEGIAKIESGETKVSMDDLNDLVTKMIKQDALNQVK